MLVLGIATSHAPNILLPVELWPYIYKRMIDDVAQPASAAAETPDAILALRGQIDDSLAKLREQLEAARPDVIVMVGDDQEEVFARWFNPQLAVFTGEEVSGHTLPRLRDQPGINQEVTMTCSSVVGRAIADGLMERGFDPVVISKLAPLSKPEGIGHAFTRPGQFLGIADSGVPVVPIFLNMYFDPLPSGKRCYQLGEALREIIEARPERIAVVASGGLSHDPKGERAGWIDRRMDRWVLDRLAKGKGDELASLFAFESDNFQGGTGEIRAWIVAAGAMGSHPAEVVNYLPVHHAVTGLGFAYWPVGVADTAKSQ